MPCSMTMPIDVSMAGAEFQNLDHADLILSTLTSLGVKQDIDIAMSDEEDIHEISDCDDVIASFSSAMAKSTPA